MIAVDYTHLFERVPHLGLDFDRPGALMAWQIRDRNTGRLYTRAVTLDSAIQFIRAAVRLGDATADEDSIEFFRAQRVAVDEAWMVAQDSEFLPRVSALSERGASATVAPSGELAPRSENVFPLRPLEQIDEIGGAA